MSALQTIGLIVAVLTFFAACTAENIGGFITGVCIAILIGAASIHGLPFTIDWHWYQNIHAPRLVLTAKGLL